MDTEGALIQFPPIPLVGEDDKVRYYHETIQPHQTEFHMNSAKFRWTGGGVGSGKSLMATIEGFFQSWRYPDNLGLILRRTMTSMSLSSIKDFWTIIPKQLIWRKREKAPYTVWMLNHVGWAWLRERGKYLSRRQQDTWLLHNQGLSEIVFISYEGKVSAQTKFTSANLGWYFVEQAEEGDYKMHEWLAERLRRANSGRCAWYVSNPQEGIPQEDNWLWQIFSEDSPQHREGYWEQSVRTDMLSGILPADYEESLVRDLTEETYRRRVLGEHDSMSHAVYREFSRAVHVVPHQEPASRWVKGIGLDHGLRNPTAWVNIALLPSGEAYVFEDYEKAEELISVHARVLRNRMTAQHRIWRMDAKDFAKRNAQTGERNGDVYRRYGVPFRPGVAEVNVGIGLIQELLRFRPDRLNPFTGHKGSPMLFISERCEELIRAILRYRYEMPKTVVADRDLPESPRKWKDHLVDALRFGLTNALYPLNIDFDPRQGIVETLGSDGFWRSRYVDAPYTETPFNERGELRGEALFAGVVQGASRGSTTWRRV